MNLNREKKSGKLVGFLLTLFCLTATLFAGSGVLYAQDVNTDENTGVNSGENKVVFGLDLPMEADALPPLIDPKQKAREDFLKNIIAELRATQKEYYDVSANMMDTETRIDSVHEDITTLSGQMTNLVDQIVYTENLIKNVKVQIVHKENSIKILYADIKEKEIAIAQQKDVLLEYLKTVYMQESAVSDTMSENDNINIAKLLLSGDPVSEQLQMIKYVNILEEAGHEIFDQLDSLVDEIEDNKEFIESERVRLNLLYDRLSGEKRALEIQKEAKQNLLLQTRGEEEIFATLLEESKKQQLQIHEDMEVLREALKLVTLKMEQMGDAFDPDDFKSIFSGETISVYEFIAATRDAVDIDFEWPVPAGGGISAYFRDSGYVAVFGVRHNAIDIRVPQETIIKAPADGVVYKARDNGFGYSYLILAHKGGYMTVYGHLPQFFVEPGEKVFAGQIIGLTGATPGTKGAGLMTTGAHLHFEMMKDGNYVDPLLYLPLSPLPSIPDKYTALVIPEPPGGILSVF